MEKDRLGILHYTRHLTLRPINIVGPRYNPRDIQEYLPHLRSITKLHSLTLDHFHITLFILVFNAHFNIFTSTLRHLDMRYPEGADRDLLYIVCQGHSGPILITTPNERLYTVRLSLIPGNRLTKRIAWLSLV